VYELGIDPNTSTTKTSVTHDDHELQGTAASTPFVTRQGYVYLSNNQYGKLALGKQQSFTYDYLGKIDGGRGISVPGSLYYNRATTFDRGNALSYAYDSQYFDLGAQYKAQSASNASNPDTNLGMHSYELSGGAKYQNYGLKATYTQAAGMLSTNVVDAATLINHPGTGVKSSVLFANAYANFDKVRLDYAYYQSKFNANDQLHIYTPMSTPSAGLGMSEYGFAKATLQQFSAIAPVTPQIDIYADYLLIHANANGSMAGNSNVGTHGNGFQFGTRYALSKRTNIYAGYGSEQLNKIGYKENGYTVGLKHTF
jgi:predicted porin